MISVTVQGLKRQGLKWFSHLCPHALRLSLLIARQLRDVDRPLRNA